MKHGCRCQRCGNLYTVDVLIADALWERIRLRGPSAGSGLLCGPCIMSRIEDLAEFAAYRLDPIVDKHAIDIDLGSVAIGPGPRPSTIWLMKPDGEGGEYPMDDFAAHVLAFVKERF